MDSAIGLSLVIAIGPERFGEFLGGLRTVDEQARLLNETVATFDRSLKLTTNRYKVGVAGRSDVVQAETQLRSAQAQLLDVGRAHVRGSGRGHIAVLADAHAEQSTRQSHLNRLAGGGRLRPQRGPGVRVQPHRTGIVQRLGQREQQVVAGETRQHRGGQVPARLVYRQRAALVAGLPERPLAHGQVVFPIHHGEVTKRGDAIRAGACQERRERQGQGRVPAGQLVAKRVRHGFFGTGSRYTPCPSPTTFTRCTPASSNAATMCRPRE